jgi:hypothetical protein
VCPYSIYVCTICTRPLCQSRLGKADDAVTRELMLYNGCLVTWMVICLTANKRKPVLLYLLGFTFAGTANIYVVVMCAFQLDYTLYFSVAFYLAADPGGPSGWCIQVSLLPIWNSGAIWQRWHAAQDMVSWNWTVSCHTAGPYRSCNWHVHSWQGS